MHTAELSANTMEMGVVTKVDNILKSQSCVYRITDVGRRLVSQSKQESGTDRP